MARGPWFGSGLLILSAAAFTLALGHLVFQHALLAESLVRMVLF